MRFDFFRLLKQTVTNCNALINGIKIIDNVSINNTTTHKIIAALILIRFRQWHIIERLAALDSPKIEAFDFEALN